MRFKLLVLCLVWPTLAFTHHSISAIYDLSEVRSLQGTITNVRWINPHVRVTLETTTDDGATELWDLEASAINMLQRAGVSRDVLEVGSKITARGPTARHGRKAMIAAVIDLPDGQSVTIFAPIAAAVGLIESSGVPDSAAGYVAARNSGATGRDDLFRVWTLKEKANVSAIANGYPLTEEALAAIRNYDPITDDPALLCEPPGVPVILDTPFPLAFVRQGNNIEMQYEEWDGRRTIHMGPINIPANVEPTQMGYSVGHFANGSLTIETQNVAYPFFDDTGTPQSPESRIVERYSLISDSSEIVWRATITDPQNFREPVGIGGSLVWNPDETIKPYNCTLP
ncbi:MAG: DUF6152 family protein [Woeseiaceae bacterium]